MTEITLNLQYPLNAAHAANHAEMCVQGAKQIDGLELDYSAESLDIVDQIIEGWREDEMALQELATVLFSFGCYVGEVFVRNAGAKWMENVSETETFPIYLQLPGGTVCRPIEKVFHRFEEGDGSQLLRYYETYVSADSSDEKELVPVLRTVEEDDLFEQSAVNQRVCDDLSVFACRKIITPDGYPGIDYVTREQASQGDVSEDQLIEYCYENFFAGEIKVNAYEQDGQQMLEFTHEDGFACSLIGHKESYERVCELLGSRDITLVIVNPDVFLATPTGSTFEPTMRQIANDARSEGAGPIHLIPAVYRWTEAKLSRIA